MLFTGTANVKHAILRHAYQVCDDVFPIRYRMQPT